MSVLQVSKGSNYHNHFIKIVSRFFAEVDGSMTFSCIKQGFVVVSFYIVSDQCFLFGFFTHTCCNKPLKSSKLIQVVMHKLKALRRRVLKAVKGYRNLEVSQQHEVNICSGIQVRIKLLVKLPDHLFMLRYHS